MPMEAGGTADGLRSKISAMVSIVCGIGAEQRAQSNVRGVQIANLAQVVGET